MEEKEIMEIASNKALSLADCRVRCIVDNAKCIMKASTESMSRQKFSCHAFHELTFIANFILCLIFVYRL